MNRAPAGAILGISAYYHDSAAALLRDGEILAAAQEERFSRTKHDARFPAHAVRWCLEYAGIGLGDLRYVVFYDKPLLKFDRLLETYLAHAPRGFSSFVAAMPIWLEEKLFLKAMLRSFGFLFGGMFALVFGLALPWLFGRPWPLWPWILCAALAAVALAAPRALRPVHRGWMRFGAALGTINTYLLLALAFAALIVPVALALRIARRDAMRRRRDPRATTYREASRVPAPDHMEKPY